MITYITRDVSRRAKRLGIADDALLAAIAGIEAGRIDANLGNGLIKQRVKLPGKGKSGGARSIIFVKYQNHAVFIHIFAKNEQSNLTPTELTTYRSLAKALSGLSSEDISNLLVTEKWRKIE